MMGHDFPVVTGHCSCTYIHGIDFNRKLIWTTSRSNISTQQWNVQRPTEYKYFNFIAVSSGQSKLSSFCFFLNHVSTSLSRHYVLIFYIYTVLLPRFSPCYTIPLKVLLPKKITAFSARTCQSPCSTFNTSTSGLSKAEAKLSLADHEPTMPGNRAAWRNVHFHDASNGAILGGFYQQGSLTDATLIWLLSSVVLIIEGHLTVTHRGSGRTVTPSNNPVVPGDYDIYYEGGSFLL